MADFKQQLGAVRVDWITQNELKESDLVGNELMMVKAWWSWLI